MLHTDELKTLHTRLTQAHAALEGKSILSLFDGDAERVSNFSAHQDDILLDYSKQLLDQNAFDLLIELMRSSGVEKRRDAMFSGEVINTTEQRAVLHTALRSKQASGPMIDGQNVAEVISEVKQQLSRFVDGVRDGSIAGSGGKFTDIVNIGIGGSDLGPAMAYKALAPYRDGPRCHFVSNVDSADLNDTLELLNPATTLFLVASKTFTTQETLTNANSAREWLVDSLGDAAVGEHFVALSTNLKATAAFGIREDRTFGFWDWVGGRYSLWSAIGLSVMLAIGNEAFDELLNGANAIDEHFRSAPLEENLPVIMAAVGVWNRNFCNHSTVAVLPYENRLVRFPAYLQQMDMESNGKQTTLDGTNVSYKTGPIVWGEPGTNGQHAFYQLIHQGKDVIPCEFLLARNSHEEMSDHHAKLAANCFAQSEALMIGKSLEAVLDELKDTGLSAEEINALAPHKVFPGNRPSTTLMYDKLTPAMLGKLIALYEHKVFVQGVVWNINSFDQWGVELGKQLAGSLLPFVKGEGDLEDTNRDNSTTALVRSYRQSK